jgi:hypothetical protein
VIAAALAAASIALSAAAPPADAQLGDAQLVGQRLITGFEGQTPPSALVKRIRAGRIAGVILFADNFDYRGDAQGAWSRTCSRFRVRAGCAVPCW